MSRKMTSEVQKVEKTALKMKKGPKLFGEMRKNVFLCNVKKRILAIR